VKDRRERWGAEDERTIRQAVDSAAEAAKERRRQWEDEYQHAVETWYARELQASERLCDELETEVQQSMSDARTRIAEHGGQLRDQWDPDDHSISARSS
jgi:transketolase